VTFPENFLGFSSKTNIY